MKHQVEGVKRICDQRRVGLWFDVGSGKTRTAIEGTVLKGGSTLIVLPNSLMSSWEDEFRKWAPAVEPVRLWPSAKIDKVLNNGCPAVALIPYSQFTLALKRLPRFDNLVCDESVMIKTHSAKRTKAVMDYVEKKNPSKVVLMSGNPAEKLWDYWSQYRILGEEEFPWSYFAFRSRFFEEARWIYAGGRRQAVDWRLRPSEKAEFQRILAKRGMRVRKEDCFDLPPLTMTKRTFKLCPELNRAYETMEKDHIIPLMDDEEAVALSVLAEKMKLRQITSGFVRNTEGKDVLISNQKFDLLDEVVQDCAGQLIVVCQFVFEMDTLKEKYKDSVGLVNGRVSQAQKEEAIKAFQEGRLKILAIHPESGGRGLNLQNAQTMCFFSQTWSLEQFIQSTGRIYRSGQQLPTTIISLLAEGTIDEEIHDAVINKQDYAQKFLEGLRAGRRRPEQAGKKIN